MNNNEQKLIELNNILSKLIKQRDELSHGQLDLIRHSISGGDLTPGVTSTILTQGAEGATGPNPPTCPAECVGATGPTGATGPVGATGPQGESGPVGATGASGVCSCQCAARVVSQDYTATLDDYYIGVNSLGPVTITLPRDCSDCDQIIVKAEMGPPLGNRKITIITSDGSTIDGADDYIIEVPYQSVKLLCRGMNWHII